MPKKVFFTDVRKAEYLDAPELGELKENHVHIKTLFTGISAGTELVAFRGDSPFMRREYDPSTRLFYKTDSGGSRGYPMTSGYENVGRVLEVGSTVESLKAGDIVFTHINHCSEYAIAESQPDKLPDGLDPRCGVIAALVGVAYNSILDARIVPGETVVVFGAGIVGQILIQLARFSSPAAVVSVDLQESRLEAARTSGADVTLNPQTTDDVALAIREMTDNRGADVVFEASTSTVALHEAIRTAGYNCRVIVVSYYAGEANGLYLGEEFHHNRIRLISSQNANVNPHLHPAWDSGRKHEAAIAFLSQLKLDHLISHTIPAEEAQRAFDLVDQDQGNCLQVLLSYE